MKFEAEQTAHLKDVLKVSGTVDKSRETYVEIPSDNCPQREAKGRAGKPFCRRVQPVTVQQCRYCQCHQ